MSIRRIACALLLAAVAGCSSPPPPPMPQPVLLDPDSACLKDLRDSRVAFEPLGVHGADRCAVVNPVKVSSGAVAWNRPGVLSCTMARTLVRFETEVVQPLAIKHFGKPIRRIDHAGTYDCRPQRNDRTAALAAAGASLGGRTSEHGKGQAIDVTSFELADGTIVSVKSDWRAGGAKSAFLKDVAKSSCEIFNVVLTPNHDRFHQDHFHLDIGPHRLCGT